MTVTRRSPISGEVNTLDLPITPEQVSLYMSENRPYIQDIFPNLTPAEREFIKSGITEDEWSNTFADL